MKDDDLQQRYLEYQLLTNQIKQLQQQIEQLTQHLVDLGGIKEGLDNVSNSEIGEELLVPVGSGVFIKASLKENKEAIMTVGANVSVDKNIKDVVIIVDKQIEEVKHVIHDMEMELGNLGMRIEELQKELSK